MTAAVLRSPSVRDAAAALAMFVAGLVLIRTVPEIRIVWYPAADPGDGARIAVLALACAGMVLRQRLPLAGLAVTTAAFAAGPFALGQTDLGTVLAFADLLYCAVLFPSRTVSRAVCVVSAALVAGLTVASLVAQGGHSGVQTLLNLLLLGIPVLWAAEVRRHRELADVQRERAAAASQLADAGRRAAVAAERARMARDLHDVVAGQLSAIALQSEAALSGPEPDPQLTERVLRGVRDASVSALAEMRTMIGLLRTEPGSGPDEDPRTAPARLDQLGPLLTSARSWGLTVRVRDDRPADDRPAAGVELAAYRIVQEGLTNVAKHAPGADVTLHLWHEGDRLMLRLDNGATATPARTADGTSSGTGLDGLAERASAVGGTLHAGPERDGWRVMAALPRSGAPVRAR